MLEYKLHMCSGGPRTLGFEGTETVGQASSEEGFQSRSGWAVEGQGEIMHEVILDLNREPQ